MNPLALIVSASLLLAASGQGAGLAPEQPARRGRETPGAPSAPARAPTAAETIRATIETSLTALGDHQDYPRARAELQQTFDQAIAYTPDNAALIRDAAFALRLITQLGAADEKHRSTLFRFLRASDDFARTLAFLIKPEDDPAAVYDVLARLHNASERSVIAFPALAAAVCVVHDSPLRAKASPQEAAREIDPVAIFGYYVKNAAQMVCSPRTTAPELLIHIVDCHAEVPELHWALSKHRGDQMVHKRYSDLVYDTAHFKYNRPKKVSAHAYTLENIRRHGGVCEEQAYYASHVAKAIGTPSIEISGRGPGVSHAWVGVLLMRGSTPAWYMEEGRHEEYEDLRGTAIDPQTRRAVPDDQIALSARIAQLSAADRHTAQAYTDAARRIFLLSAWVARPAGGAPSQSNSAFLSAGPRPQWPPPLNLGDGIKPPAAPPADDSTALKLLETAANAAPAMPFIWQTLAEAAAAGRLSKNDRARWFDAFYSAVGEHHSDYCFGILAAIASAIPDPAEQSAAWEWAIKRYHQRKDLCVRAFIGRGEGWRNAGRFHEAYSSYMEAVTHYSNDATEAVEALDRAARMLKDQNREGHLVDMYKTAFQRTRRPSTVSPAFYRQSNFYRIGDRYAFALEQAGRAAEARSVRNQLRAGEDKP